MPLGNRGEVSGPVWTSGKQKDLGSISASALFSHQKGYGLWTLSCDFVRHN